MLPGRDGLGVGGDGISTSGLLLRSWLSRTLWPSVNLRFWSSLTLIPNSAAVVFSSVSRFFRTRFFLSRLCRMALVVFLFTLSSFLGAFFLAVIS